MSDRSSRVEAIFDRAVLLPPHERLTWLAEACLGDAQLCSEVESLLAHDEQAAPEFLSPPVVPASLHPESTVDDLDPLGLVGRDVGGFLVNRILSGGGMGIVYLAEQQQPKREVALKVLRPGALTSEWLSRFEHESQILGRLRHPNIAHVHSSGTFVSPCPRSHIASQRPIPYFSMEYVPNALPITRYAELHQLDTRARLELFAIVCDAVHYGHGRGVIHRDLKPSNILVDENGSPRIIDFGIARCTDSDIAATTRMTEIGAILGTIQYMSPEQCAADPNDIDNRSDVYSLGVILYELLVGRLPYDLAAAPFAQAVRIVCEQPAGPPSRTVLRAHPMRRLRGDLECILLKCLEKNRDRRYQSAGELAADIRRFLQGQPTDARPPTAWVRGVRWVARHPLVTTVAACLLIAAGIIGGTATAVWHANRKPNEIWRHPEAREARLLSLGRTILRRWHTYSNHDTGLVAAHDVLREDRRLFAIVGYGRDPGNPDQGKLLVYDTSRGWDVPFWVGEVRPADLLPEIANREQIAQVFHLQRTWMEDVFPTNPDVELVAVFAHAYSMRLIRVYSLDGEVLYQFWHDGEIADCMSLPSQRVLLFAGVNSEEYVENYALAALFRPHFYVAFAVFPELGARYNRVLRSRPDSQGPKTAWYKFIHPLSNNDQVARVELMPSDQSRPFGRIGVFYHLREGLVDGVAWDIDAAGAEISGSRAAGDQYLLDVRESSSVLPGWKDVKLGAAPEPLEH